MALNQTRQLHGPASTQQHHEIGFFLFDQLFTIVQGARQHRHPQLCEFIVKNGTLPYSREDEGWCDLLSGQFGIRIIDWEGWQMDEEAIEVVEKQTQPTAQ